MRLEPIEHPSNVLLRIAGWITKRQFGKVITPLKVIYSRKLPLLFIANKIYQFQEKSVSLEPSLRFLITTLVSRLNGCQFCNDISLAQTVQRKLGSEKFFALGDEIDINSHAFTPKEKAVINFVNEYFEKRSVSDETFNKLREYFDENQIIEIVAINACEHYFNALAIPLGIESDGLRQLALQEA